MHPLAWTRNTPLNRKLYLPLLTQAAVNAKRRQSKNPTFLALMGVHELFSLEMWRAATTELVASFCFLFMLSTTIIACLESHQTDPKLVIPIAVFLIAFLILIVTVPLSGGHLSPVFTFIAALRGLVTFVRAFFYLLGQCLGSIIAYLIMKNIMDTATADKYALVGCIVNRNGVGVSVGTALIVEFSCTFLVLYVAITIAFDKRRFQELGLTMVCVIISGVYALSIFVSITVTGRAGYGGAGLNPARCLGAALLLGGSLWDGHWVFWVGPFCSCIVYYGYTLILPKQGFVRKDEEQDIMQIVRTYCLGTEDETDPTFIEGKV